MEQSPEAPESSPSESPSASADSSPESSSASPPELSVIVAAHNEARMLPRCLASLFAQRTARRFEIIVVDNASTDATAEIARGFAGVRVVSEPTLGAVNAKTAGVAAARAPLVAVLDADSICPDDWLDQIANAFASEPQLVGLSGPARYETDRAWVHAVMFLWYGYWKTLQKLAGNALYAVGTNVAFRRQAYLDGGGFDTKVLVGGDEVGLFRNLRRVGKTRYTDALEVKTDSRRTDVGFWRFFTGTVLLHYVFNYPIYRVTGRSLLKRYRPGSTL